MKQQKRRVTNEDKAQIKGLWNAGYSRAQIANTLSMSVNTIRDVIKRMQNEGVLSKRNLSMQLKASEIQALATQAGVSEETVTFLLPMARKNLRNVPINIVVGSYLALWSSQKGRCYYTGARLTTDNSLTSAVLVPSGGLGKVFVTKAAAAFRGKMSHTTFLKMVGAVARHSLRKRV
jgi:hypothetical protein